MWSKPISDFGCVSEVGLVVGGTEHGYEYLSSVEIFAGTDSSCVPRVVQDFPERITGAAAGMVGSHGVVCGGAVLEYGDCTLGHAGKVKNAKYSNQIFKPLISFRSEVLQV